MLQEEERESSVDNGNAKDEEGNKDLKDGNIQNEENLKDEDIKNERTLKDENIKNERTLKDQE